MKENVGHETKICSSLLAKEKKLPIHNPLITEVVGLTLH